MVSNEHGPPLLFFNATYFLADPDHLLVQWDNADMHSIIQFCPNSYRNEWHPRIIPIKDVQQGDISVGNVMTVLLKGGTFSGKVLSAGDITTPTSA